MLGLIEHLLNHRDGILPLLATKKSLAGNEIIGRDPFSTNDFLPTNLIPTIFYVLYQRFEIPKMRPKMGDKSWKIVGRIISLVEKTWNHWCKPSNESWKTGRVYYNFWNTMKGLIWENSAHAICVLPRYRIFPIHFQGFLLTFLFYT